MLVLEHCKEPSVQAKCANGFLIIRSGVPFVSPLLTCVAVGPFYPTVVHRQQHGHFSSLPFSSSVSTGWAVRSCRQEFGVSEDVNFVGSLFASGFALRRLSFSGCSLSSFPHIRSNCSCTENSNRAFEHQDYRGRVDLLGMPLVACLVGEGARGGGVG